MKKRIVHSVHPVGFGGDPHPDSGWAVNANREDGVLWSYCFPTAALWVRSAEYGIDITDFETLKDVVLYEHILLEHGLHASHEDPTYVYNTDAENARLHHLKRIRDVQSLVVFEDPGNLLDSLRSHHLDTLKTSPHRSYREEYQAQVRLIRAASVKAFNIRRET